MHCGLCLNQCPTYRVLRLEPESPRGRIHLVKAAADGRIELNERFKEHLYLCLFCRACETACPSGVQYGHIAETARAVIGPPGSKLARAFLNLAFTQLLPFPRRLRIAVRRVASLSTNRLAAAGSAVIAAQDSRDGCDAAGHPATFFSSKAQALSAIGPRRARVAFLNGCVMPLLFGDINDATVRVLQRNGCEVCFPKGADLLWRAQHPQWRDEQRESNGPAQHRRIFILPASTPSSSMPPAAAPR